MQSIVILCNPSLLCPQNMINSRYIDDLGQQLVKSVYYKLVCIFALLCTPVYAANEEQANVGAWSLGVNVGVGQRSAFIIGQDDLDIYLLPDFHYYGERLFFDNGTLGYTFHEQEEFAFSLIAEINPYGLYFEQSAFGESFNTLYLSKFSGISGEATEGDSEGLNGVITTTPGNPTSPSTSGPGFGHNANTDSYNLPKPDLSADIGFLANWFLTNNQDISIKLVRDISSKHSGVRAKFNWSFKHQISQIKLRTNIGFDWLDTDSSNYYFGLSPENTNFQTSHYETKSSINPFISISATMPLTPNMSLIAHLKYLKLDSAISASPLTSQGYTVTQFAGIHYKFW